MGQKSLKINRRALRKTAQEEKNNIVIRYMTDNWDKVVVSSVAIIRAFDFKNRFQIAMTILFKPIKKQNPKTDQLDRSLKNKRIKDVSAIPRPLPKNRGGPGQRTKG
jgi:hypothetical protein